MFVFYFLQDIKNYKSENFHPKCPTQPLTEVTTLLIKDNSINTNWSLRNESMNQSQMRSTALKGTECRLTTLKAKPTRVKWRVRYWIGYVFITFCILWSLQWQHFCGINIDFCRQHISASSYSFSPTVQNIYRSTNYKP